MNWKNQVPYDRKMYFIDDQTHCDGAGDLDGGREQIDRNQAVERYHLDKDIGETNNLAATEIAKRDDCSIN